MMKKINNKLGGILLSCIMAFSSCGRNEVPIKIDGEEYMTKKTNGDVYVRNSSGMVSEIFYDYEFDGELDAIGLFGGTSRGLVSHLETDKTCFESDSKHYDSKHYREKIYPAILQKLGM
jgi:hypothetical protein